MSVQAMSWVFDYSRAELGARLVILSIANHADKYGRNSWASVRTLAMEAKLSERQTRYALRDLEALGEIAKAGKYGPRADRQTTVYELPVMINGGQIMPLALGDEGQDGAVTGGKIRQNGGHPIAPKPSFIRPLIRPLKEQAASPGLEKKKLDPEIKAAADRIYASDPAKFRRLVVWIKSVQALGYLPAWIATALTEFEKSAGEIEDWWPYLDKIGAKVRTASLQAESVNYKKQDPASVGNILAALQRGTAR